MSGKFSAYLLIYNDWDFLDDLLRSIAPYVDELIVVDGAYEWIAPYLRALGENPERSDDRVHDIIASCGIPHRILTGVWSGQVEKRLVGYRACSNRYICRVDADEVFFFHEDKLDKFFRKKQAIGLVEMPTYIAPGWVKSSIMWPPRGRRAKLRALFFGKHIRFSRQAFLYDSTRVDADIHVNYLSMVRGADKRPRPEENPFTPYRHPVAFNAHLTIWRTLPTSVYRAESYVLHYILHHGVPWLPQLQGQPLADLTRLFEFVPPREFREIMLASRLGTGNMLGERLTMMPTPLTPGQEKSFVGYYDNLLSGHATLNRHMCDDGLHFTPEMPIVIDVSNKDCMEAAAPGGLLYMEFESELAAATAHLHQIIPRHPWRIVTELVVQKTGNRLFVELPEPQAAPLRREIELKVTTASANPLQRFRILPEGPPKA